MLAPMCYSAQILADFTKYRSHGGHMDIKAFVDMAAWTRKKGSWIKGVPKAMRNAFMGSTAPEEQETREVSRAAYREAAAALEDEIAARLVKAEAVLAGPKPTKTAENDRRVATNKIAAARAKLAEVSDHAGGAEYARIWPGDLTPVLIRDHATGERRVVPMRYRCRLPGWDDAKERAKPGTYNARMDSLMTVWRKLWGYNHGTASWWPGASSRAGRSTASSAASSSRESATCPWSWNSVPSRSRKCSWPACGDTWSQMATSLASTPSPLSPVTHRPKWRPPVTIGASFPSSPKT